MSINSGSPQLSNEVKNPNKDTAAQKTKERLGWESQQQGPQDWKAQVASWEFESAMMQKKLDPEFIIEERDKAKEKSIFATSHSSGIRFEELGKVPVEIKGNDIPPPMESFDTDDLFWLIKENIQLCKFKQPTPVQCDQKYSIPIIAKNRDMMASAQTGSGKTAAFVIPILHRMLDTGPCDVEPMISEDMLVTVYPLLLILEPTRELAIQIYDEVKKVYGGVPIDKQVKHIRTKGVDLLIATPGRLQDLIDRGFISLSKVRTLVLDEADRMLDMGFEPHIRKLIETDMPTSEQGRQTLLFSATFPPNIRRLAQTFLNSNHIVLHVGRVGSVSQTIVQKLVFVERGAKDSQLLEILTNAPPGKKSKTLIFTDTKTAADSLEELLPRTFRGLKVGVIHGGRDQWQREAALDNFKSGDVMCLVATAVAARGLDIYNVAHVINYDIPKVHTNGVENA
ncbi:DEAD-box ATP-dependent RNA helicase [Borealophlyctis nickersoniae]|nr:DEAD-box ATP-dependent RNA helicase [Borealophlyctis nickersoniae]